jgi:predicted nucleic acid-binding protein
MSVFILDTDTLTGTNDLRIAAIVVNNAGTLITRNTKDFGKIPRLAIEDWSLPMPLPPSKLE